MGELSLTDEGLGPGNAAFNDVVQTQRELRTAVVGLDLALVGSRLEDVGQRRADEDAAPGRRTLRERFIAKLAEGRIVTLERDGLRKLVVSELRGEECTDSILTQITRALMDVAAKGKRLAEWREIVPLRSSLPAWLDKLDLTDNGRIQRRLDDLAASRKEVADMFGRYVKTGAWARTPELERLRGSVKTALASLTGDRAAKVERLLLDESYDEVAQEISTLLTL